MKMRIKDSGRIELMPDCDKDWARLAQIPEGSNKVFVFYTADGGEDGAQEALVIHIGHIPSLKELGLPEAFDEEAP
uniref:Uncharacterized protein n=1 Tax=viral metagenome TaxID=1070528 RepID=A0A6M3LTW8_9ZZZZ